MFIEENMEGVVDSQGNLAQLTLRNAEICCIDFRDQIKLYFNSEERRRLCYTLLTVRHFHCSDMTMTNVAEEFSMATKCHLYIAEEDTLFGLPAYHSASMKRHISITRRELLHGKLILVKMVPHRGCKLLAICERVRFERILLTSQ